MTRRVIVILTVLFLLPVGTTFGAVEYAAATWNDSSIHLLDANLNSVSSFGVPSNPNALASQAGLIYGGFFVSQQVIAYDTSGVQQFQWNSPTLIHLQGMEIVSGELAFAYTQGGIDFVNPLTGAFIRSIPNAGGITVEGLAYDGNLLWLLGDELIGVDPLTGLLQRTLPNPALNEEFGGTALSISVDAASQLILGAASGNWYRVSTLDGSVTATGNNGLNMFGLTEVAALQPLAIPEPAALVIWSLLGAFAITIGCWRRWRRA